MTAQSTFPKIRLFVMLALALTGIILSAILTRHFYEARADENYQSACDVNDKFDCSHVARSAQAELAKDLPLSSAAGGWYVALLAVSLLALRSGWRSEAMRMQLLMGGAGLLISLYYLGVMLFKLKTGCLYCLGVDGVNLAIFGVALSLWWGGQKPPVSGGKIFVLGLAAVAAGMTGLLLFAGLKPGQEVNPLLDGLNPPPVSATESSNPAPADPAGQGLSQEEMLTRMAVENALKGPVESVGAGAELPSAGAAGAPVTVVEFADFQCGHCKHGFETLENLLPHYEGKVRVVFRQFPLDKACNPMIQGNAHPAACEAARVALCAGEQGQYMPVARALFAFQESLKPGSPPEIARELGLDMNKLNVCTASEKTAATLRRDIDEAILLKVESTPTFFINGRRLKAAPPAALPMLIDQLLAAQ